MFFQPTEVLFLKAHVECLRNNYHKSIKLLHSINKNSVEPQTTLNLMCQNNLGCIHFFMKKYNLAVSYLKKAFEENAMVLKKLPPMEKSKKFIHY